MPTGRDLRLLAALTGLALAFATGVWLGGLSADALLALPLLAFLMPLLAGRYVGEQALDRLRAAAVRRSRRPRAIADLAPRRAPRAIPSRGRLLATVHASRPPPGGALTATAC